MEPPSKPSWSRHAALHDPALPSETVPFSIESERLVMVKGHFYYAPSKEHIREAARLGIPNVVVQSTGHKSDRIGSLGDDQLCLMPKHPKIYALRKRHAPAMRKAVADVRKRIRLARSLGLKPYIHSYELSLPLEVRQAYPELLVPPANEHINADPRCSGDRELCLSDKRVRDLVADKMEEVMSHFPEAEGYVYSNHESQLATFAHSCDKCKHLEGSQLIRWLYASVRKGTDRVRKDMPVIVRLWGLTHSKELYYENRRELAGLFDHDPSYWPSRRLPALRKLRPNQPALNADLPHMLRKGDALMLKATWGDVHLNQPLNPYVGSYGDTPHIVELSFEHGLMGGLIPLVMSAQHQEMIQRLSGSNIRFALVPVNWGRSYLGSRKMPDSAQPDTWGLNALNIYLAAKLLKRPDLDLTRAALAWMKVNYGEAVSTGAVARIFEAAQVLASSLNVHGVASAVNVGQLLRPATYQLKSTLINTFWNRNHFPDGKKRTSPSDTNMRRIFAEKDTARDEAARLVREAIAETRTMPRTKLRRDYETFFKRFGDLAAYLAISRKRLWIQYKLAADKKLCYHPWQRELDALITEEQRLTTKSPYLRGIHDGSYARIEKPSAHRGITSILDGER
jgi:hypothetical protein